MPKKLPLRQCLACREMKPKRELIRVVRAPDGTVSLDRTGKSSGRGAYICRGPECLAKAIKTRAFSRALDAEVTSEITDAIAQELEAGDG